MNQYRRRPTETLAVQLRWSTWNEVAEFLGEALLRDNPGGAHTMSAVGAGDTCGEPGPEYIRLFVRTTHGNLVPVRHGDWILPDAEPGTFYPCAPEVFAATYELVDAPA
ncbi:hypothetical protein [Streptomyces sp. NPDC001999]